MLYIYKFTNKINNHCYIGQTNNIEKRKRGHKSESFNKKANGYNLPFHAAIRKYGWEGFDFEILEEIDDRFGREYLDEREKFFIQLFHSTIKEQGYNYTLGGDGCHTGKKSFSECCQQSKLLDERQVRDIQDMLINNYQYFEIQKKYPILTNSFLQNINNGWNFHREDLSYPLLNKEKSRKWGKEDKENIIKDLKTPISLTEISKKYHISRSYLSQINKGERWFDENNTYPLYDRSNTAWSKKCKYDLIFNNFTLTFLAEKYQKSLSTIKNINSGKSHVEKKLLYPLNKNIEENKKIWTTLF